MIVGGVFKKFFKLFLPSHQGSKRGVMCLPSYLGDKNHSGETRSFSQNKDMLVVSSCQDNTT